MGSGLKVKKTGLESSLGGINQLMMAFGNLAKSMALGYAHAPAGAIWAYSWPRQRSCSLPSLAASLKVYHH